MVDIGGHEGVSKFMSDGAIEIRMTVVGSAVEIVSGDGGIISHGYFECEGIGLAVGGIIGVIDGGEGFIGSIIIEGDTHTFDGGTVLIEREPVGLFVELDGALNPPIVESLDNILLHVG